MSSSAIHDGVTAASIRGQQAVDDVFDGLVRRYHTSNNPVLVIAVAAAIVLGLGFIAFLTAQCISRGYRGFGGVVNVNWSGPFSANVKFACIR